MVDVLGADIFKISNVIAEIKARARGAAHPKRCCRHSKDRFQIS
jgi:hypothetical protein